MSRSERESLCESLRQRAETARLVSFKTDFYALPKPAQDALYGLAALLEEAADALDPPRMAQICPVYGEAKSTSECEKCGGNIIECPVYGRGELLRRLTETA